MKKEVSLYLDTARFLAAMAVFITHFSRGSVSGGFLWHVRPLGDEAVTVFFVLSGFVIAHAVDARETTVSRYCVSRLARLYSVVLPALVLTVLLDTLGVALRPDLYTDAAAAARDWSFARMAAGLTFTNEVWTLSIRQGSNAAYWSLGYEAPYYLIFGLVLFVPARWRIAALGLAAAAVGPAILAMLPVWGAGVAAYRFCRRDVLSRPIGILLFAGSTLAWMVYEVSAWNLGRPLIPFSPWLKRPELVQDYLIALLFCINVIGLNAAAKDSAVSFASLAVAVRWLAGASFTLYLCHLPIMQFMQICLPWPNVDARSRTLVFAGTLLLVFLIASVTERRKTAWRDIIERIYGALLPRSGMAGDRVRGVSGTRRPD